MKGEISMISTVLQIVTSSGENVLRLSDYNLGPSTVTMQAMLTSVFSGGSPVSAAAYVSYYIANGQRVIPGPTPIVSATGVTEIGLEVNLQGGNDAVGALLVFVSA
jgi:hypothetical protein